jgi:hypothetical protein
VTVGSMVVKKVLCIIIMNIYIIIHGRQRLITSDIIGEIRHVQLIGCHFKPGSDERSIDH